VTAPVSERRRREVIDALRRGTVPRSGLDLLAVGLDRFESAIDAELDTAVSAGSVFKVVRGEYGAGKTFFTRWLAERAKRLGLATAEVQISETETPLHRLETVYRRICDNLATPQFPRPRCGRSSMRGSTRWRRTSSPPGRSPRPTPPRSTPPWPT
jgi:hypothetical protein